MYAAMRSRSPPLLLLLATFQTLAAVSARKSLGGGSGLQSWSSTQDEGLFTGAGRGARDQQRRDVLSQLEWVVDPLDAEAVKARSSELGKECTGAVCKYLAGKDPLRLKLRTRPAKKGAGGGDMLRAAAIVSSRSPKSGGGVLSLPPLPIISPSIKRVRAAWSTSGPRMLSVNEQNSQTFLKMDYDAASQTAHSRMEVEITLPRGRKTGKNPTVLYTFPVSEGNLGDGSTYISASSGTVTVFPNGRVKKASDSMNFSGGMVARSMEGETEDEGGVDIGKSAAHAAGGQGLVDPSWARGRAVWRRGRRVGVM